MESIIHILAVDDSEEDVRLIVREFQKAGIQAEYIRVETAEQMVDALKVMQWDVVISDHAMPQFSSGEALAILRRHDAELPFIIVSGYLGEEAAVEAMKSGCQDYVLKNNLQRLVPAVQREMKETSHRKSKQLMEREMSRDKELLAVTLRSIGDGIIVTDHWGRVVFLNRIAEELTGWVEQEACGLELPDVFKIIDKESREELESPVDIVTKESSPSGLRQNAVLVSRNGEELYISASSAPILAPDGKSIGVVLVFRDITRVKIAEEQLAAERKNLRTILDEAPVGILITTPEGRLIETNKRVETILARSFQESEPETLRMAFGCEMTLTQGLACEVAQNCAECELHRGLLGVWESGMAVHGTENHLNLPAGDGSVKKWIRTSSVPVRMDQEKRVVIVIDDITEQKETEEALRHQWSLLFGVARASSCLLTTTDHDAAVQDSLGILGEAVKVDRVRIFEIRILPELKKRVLTYRYEWCSEGTPHQLNDPELAEIPFGKNIGFDRWIKPLSGGSSVRGTVRELSGPDKDFLESKGVLSFLMFPLIVDGKTWGLITFEDSVSERIWTDNETAVLVAAGINIAGSIQRRMAENELRKAIEDSEEANRIKSQFLANVSHELRTPLNGIKGMTTLSLSTELTLEQQQYMHMIMSCADTLLNIINDILDFSRIEAKAVRIEQVQFELAEWLNQILRPMSVRAREKGLKIFSHIDHGLPPELIGDPIRLKQVLNNLIDNAMKFTEEGSVRLELIREYTLDNIIRIRFSVTDTGIGIAEDEMALLFKSFSQVDGSYTRKYGGTGLGLTISKELVEMMGGTIEVTSTKGKGSTFSFTLELGIGVGHTERANYKPTVITKSLTRLRVLLAEDERINRIMAANTLSKRGHQVEVAQNGREALELYRRSDYDVILMDIQMPEMDGIEATRLIRELEAEAGKHTPIIALTAHAFDEDRERVLMAGMDGYITKPFHATELFELIEQNAFHPAIIEQKANQLAEQAPKKANGISTQENEGFLRDIIELYLYDVPRQIERMREAFYVGDLMMVERLAHTIKGSSSYVNAEAIKNLAFKLELASRKGDRDTLEAMIPKMDELYDEFRAKHRGERLGEERK
ncbi:MAG: response regulator [Solirubrobacterales bacterium]